MYFSVDSAVFIPSVSVKLALFDFDGTITRHDTFISFGVFARGKFRFLKALVKSMPRIIAWKLKIVSNSSAKQTLFSNLFRGMRITDFQEICRNFASEIEADLRPETLELIKEHMTASHKVAIVSASIGDWIRPWANKLGIETVLATEIEVDSNGALTGRFATPNCHGEEKAVRIQRCFSLSSSDEVWAYGDSDGDLAMFRLSQHSKRI